MTLFKYANFVATELVEGISAGDTEMIVPVSAAEALPTLDVDEEIRLTLWDGQQAPEIISVTANPQTGVLTMTRGHENTTAKAWVAGTQVRCTITAEIITTALAAFFDFEEVLAANFLPLSGGTLTGALTLSGAPTQGLHAASKAYVDGIGGNFLAITGGAMTGTLNMSNNQINGLPTPNSSSSAVRKAYVDNLISGLQGQLAAGTAVYTTAGSGSAYTITTIEGDLENADLVDGMAFIMRPHVNNEQDATLAVDNIDAKPLHLTAGTGVPDEILVAGTPYTIVYDSNEDAWVISGALNIVGLFADVAELQENWTAAPTTGAVAAQSAAPTGWVQDVTVNDRLLRVVSTAGGGTAGSWILSGLTIGTSSLSIAQLAAHPHGDGNLELASDTISSGSSVRRAGSTASVGSDGPQISLVLRNSSEATLTVSNTNINGDTSSAGSGSAHGHSISSDGSWKPPYYDVIRIVKS